MSKLTDIIKREVKDLVSKQGGLMVTPAVVTAVQEDYLRADVKLLGNGAEIKGMLNKSPGKLTVGQTVTVAYETLPSSGVILIANGETDPLSEGGGWEVDTAVVLDADNVHQWIAEEELMADINANTKLLYGGNAKLAAMQGYACRFGSATLDSDDAELFGTSIEVDVLWRTTSSGTLSPRKIKLELFVNNITVSSGENRYTFAIVITRYDGTTIESTDTYTTLGTATNPTDAFIVATVSGISSETSYAGASTPYGYMMCSNITINVGAVVGGDVTLLGMRSGSGAITLYIGGSNRTPNSYSCVPLDSLAEEYLNLGITQRSEPHEPEGGGT